VAGSSERERARVRLVALGCRVSRADSDALAAGLGAGLALARDGEAADLVVVNTCAVTADADAAARRAIRRAARENPRAQIVASGCGAATCPDALRALPAVVAPRAQGGIPALLDRLRARERADAPLADAPAWPPAAASPARHTRPFLKVQDGCDRRCAYCLVPAARGPSRSLPLDAVLSRLAALGARHPEVVLTGVHLGAWGHDLAPRRALSDLLRAAVARGGVRRLRLSSVEPEEAPIDALREPEVSAVVCGHLHLPVQSGSDRVLRAMGRPGGAEAFRRAVADAAEALPGACLGTDLIAGFPGETGRDHRETVALAASLPLAYLHVFPFSPRPGTVAAGLPGAVPAEAIRERVAELRALSDRLWRSFLAEQAERTLEVVVERVRDGVARGTARRYATIRWPARGELRGELAHVRITGDDGAECTGVRLDG